MIQINDNDLVLFFSSRLRLSHSTIVTRRSRINIFLRWFQGEEITPLVIEQFFYHLKQLRLSNTSQNCHLTALKSFEKYLIDRRGVKPFLDGFKPLPEEDPDIQPLTIDEIKLIKSACQKKGQTYLEQTQFDMVLFAIDTGSRYRDIQDFTIKGINLPAKEITYRQHKTGKKIIIYIADDYLLSVLERRIKGKSPDDLVFPNTQGKIMYQPDFSEWLTNFAKSLGIVTRVSPHILRHSYGQNAYDRTGDIYLTQGLLGQKSILSTLRYVKNSRVKLKKAQKNHPHVTMDIPPQEMIEMIGKDFDGYMLSEDKRFDPLKILKLKHVLMEGLYEALRI